ncbi:polyribonucleotide nucleotidyltransferase, partial [Aduncisulcus paluster]
VDCNDRNAHSKKRVTQVLQEVSTADDCITGLGYPYVDRNFTWLPGSVLVLIAQALIRSPAASIERPWPITFRVHFALVQIEEGIFESTAVLDNGNFGTRTIRFEAGRLAQQAAGSVVAYLDDETMLLSATTASKTPKDHFDFFP